MKPKDLRSNHLPNTHGLNLENYNKLVKSRTETRQFKKVTGFTAKRGQCGFCMKFFQSPKHLLYHQRRIHWRKSGTTNTQKIEHKGVSKVFSLLTITYCLKVKCQNFKRVPDEKKTVLWFRGFYTVRIFFCY